MVGCADGVAGIELGVSPDERRVHCGSQRLVQRIGYLCRADGQRHLHRFAACVIVARLGCDAQIGQLVGAAPFACELTRRSVALEVVGKDNRRVARDVLVAGVARSDSTICWRCCWCCEKCNYSRKQHQPGTSD